MEQVVKNNIVDNKDNTKVVANTLLMVFDFICSFISLLLAWLFYLVSTFLSNINPGQYGFGMIATLPVFAVLFILLCVFGLFMIGSIALFIVLLVRMKDSRKPIIIVYSIFVFLILLLIFFIFFIG